MKFTKMHGIGNDYVYVNCFTEQVEDPEQVSRRISDRHFGIGSDGLVLIKPSAVADFKMEIYNADGSRAKMCGNGIRCVAKYVYDYGLTDQTEITVETDSGIKTLLLTVEQQKVILVQVDMGAPILVPEEIPVDAGVIGAAADEPIVNRPMTVNKEAYHVTCVSMGNPHCIVPVEDVDSLEIEKIGPAFERHPAFPERVNTEFIRVLDPKTIQMRVWERGSGETLACGTGACAVAVACSLNGWTGDEVTVCLAGGDLHIRWDKEKQTVFMIGPATVVFDGEIDLASCR